MLSLFAVGLVPPVLGGAYFLLRGGTLLALLFVLTGLLGPLMPLSYIVWNDVLHSTTFTVNDLGLARTRARGKRLLIPWLEIERVRTLMFQGRLYTVIMPPGGTLLRKSPSFGYFRTDPPGQCFALLAALGDSPAAEKFDTSTEVLFDVYLHAKEVRSGTSHANDIVCEAYRALLLGRYYHARRLFRLHAKRTGRIHHDLLRLEYVTESPSALRTCREALQQDPDNNTARYFLARGYTRAFDGSSVFAPLGAAPFAGRVKVGMLEQARDAWMPLLDSSEYGDDARETLHTIQELMAVQKDRAGGRGVRP